MQRSVAVASAQSEDKSPVGHLSAHGAPWVLPLIGRAIDRVMQRKAAAALMGVDQGNLTRQLNGEGHLSALRLAKLPPEFWTAFTEEVRLHFGTVTREELRQQAEEHMEIARRLYARAAGF